jgi:hypothetical protein
MGLAKLHFSLRSFSDETAIFVNKDCALRFPINQSSLVSFATSRPTRVSIRFATTLSDRKRTGKTVENENQTIEVTPTLDSQRNWIGVESRVHKDVAGTPMCEAGFWEGPSQQRSSQANTRDSRDRENHRRYYDANHEKRLKACRRWRKAKKSGRQILCSQT